MHIPLPEFNIAWYAAGGEDALKAIEENGGFRDEKHRSQRYQTFHSRRHQISEGSHYGRKHYQFDTKRDFQARWT